MKSSAHTLGDGHERLIYLDFLRILACLCIITVHFNATVSGYANGIFVYNNSVIPNHYFGNLSLGDIGVSFFFMISGASLQYVYPEGCRPLKKYYFKRAMAIYPAFWIAFAAFTTFDFIWSGGLLPDIPLQKLLWSVTGMDGYALTMGWDQAGFYQIGEWYLGCILLIYIIYPLVSKGVNKYPVATLIGMACIYALLIHRIQYIWFFLRLPEVMLGMIFIKYVKSAKKHSSMGDHGSCFCLPRDFRPLSAPYYPNDDHMLCDISFGCIDLRTF